MLSHALTIFVCGFLLFLLQPLVGKLALPGFGSSPQVWTTALVFFQVALLVGYAYAHLIARVLPTRGQCVVHVALLGTALWLLPLAPAESWLAGDSASPGLEFLRLLAIGIGAPFVLLAATSPLLQQWAARSQPGRSPYRLYAVSNAAALLALISYPIVFEPLLSSGAQSLLWSFGFGAAALLSAWSARVAYRSAALRSRAHGAAERQPPGRAPRPGEIVGWLALSAAGSIVLLATLNVANRDLPPVPFLFVLPLGLYLLTFIIAFDHDRWYRRGLFSGLLHLAVAGGCAAIHLPNLIPPAALVCLLALVLFSCCMSCHGELARRKPEPGYLTLFYLMVALGGALGGVFVGLLAPLLFAGYWEYEIGLIAAYALVMLPLARGLGPVALVAAVCIALLGGLAWTVAGMNWILEGSRVIEQTRGFFGTLQVVEESIGAPPAPALVLYHGRIMHGLQFQDENRARVATAYYSRQSGIGLALAHHPGRSRPDRPFRIGVVGLGPGTLAAYANEPPRLGRPRTGPADTLRFYEIDAEVVRLAGERFSYLGDARARGARIDVVVGDARLEMERELARGQPQRFDVLAVDAFSGDAVPMHLLTRECFATYRAHLAPDGILAVHVSIRYVNLLPVLRALAEAYAEPAYVIDFAGDARGATPSIWVLFTRNAGFLEAAGVERPLHTLRSVEPESLLWTDDRSSLLPLLGGR